MVWGASFGMYRSHPGSMDAGCEGNRSGVAESRAVFLGPVHFRSEKGGFNNFRSTGGRNGMSGRHRRTKSNKRATSK